MDNVKQEDLFENPKEWEEHWQDMPEYDNKIIAPEIEMTFRFTSEHDFKEFMEVVTNHLYGEGIKVIDGMQRKGKYSTWYPKLEKSGNYRYIDES